MDPKELHNIISIGRYILFTKYYHESTLALIVWDHLITLSDEVDYVWKKEKTWSFWVFIVGRYSILLCKICITISLFWPGYTKEVCDHSAKWEGYYFVFVVTLGLIFLTMRVYALTEASKYVLIVSGILTASSLVTGLWIFSLPSARAVHLPDIPLDPFKACVFTAPGKYEWAYRSQVVLADVVAFVCIIIFAFRIKADQGQSRMTRLIRTIFQDGILYFFVMVWFHIGMFFNVMGRPSVLPSIAIEVLIPVMISRLVISIRKTADASLVQVWDEDHFTAAESVVHEMMDLTCASPSPTPFLPYSRKDSGRSPCPDLMIASFRSEV